jgi:hypothetical protein
MEIYVYNLTTWVGIDTIKVLISICMAIIIIYAFTDFIAD